MKEKELKPCPFCNGFASVINVEFNDGDVWYRPECSECKCGWQENYESIGEAVNVWNLRAEGRRMTEHVTDTNVGKMTEQEAITHLETVINWNVDISVPEIEAVKMAIEALKFQQSLVMCKDCLNRKGETAWCMAHNYVVMDDDYCSRGERRCEE